MKHFLKFLVLVNIVFASLVLFCGCGSDTIVDYETEYYSDESPSDGLSTVTVSFPEGYTVRQIAQRLEENGVCSANEFIEASNNESYLDEFEFDVPDPERRVYVLEGYLFPDTYEFYVGENIDSVIKKFLRNTDARITSDMRARASELGYSLDEVITLASIVQGEAGGGSQSAAVSAVIHNRLDRNPPMRIECDCSATYLKRYVKPYYDEDTYYSFCLDYNTYNCDGIPVGAINNPGLIALKAVLYPDDNDYFYFLTDGNGVYHFAETYEKHLENKRNAGF